MVDFSTMTELEIVELFIEQDWKNMDNFPDEESLSKAFDQDIAPLVIEQYGESDTCAMNEAFNNWTDMLCKDGALHPVQYNNYCYVGKYS